MSVAAAAPPSRAMRQSAAAPFESPAFAALLGMAVALLLSWSSVVLVWRTGAFANSDDAMRLVEVRDWLAGQAWFDLRQYRLDPPDGVFMHWTRVLDVPLAALIGLFSLVLPMDMAERATRIVFPLALHLVLFIGVARLARRLAGAAAMVPATLIVALAGATLLQFQPGRIHHHAAQIALCVLIAEATIAAIQDETLWPAMRAGALAALSLSINVENLPYVMVEVVAFTLVWSARGVGFARALAGFALALACGALVVFVATIGPSRYFIAACDAFSVAHLFAIAVGALLLCALAAASRRLGGNPMRLAAAAVAGAVVLGAMALAYPACLHDPLAAVDPLLRSLWLEKVEEARPLGAIVAEHPVKFVTLALSTVLGFLAAVAAIWVERRTRLAAWAAMAGFAGVGVLTTFWQVRALASASALAALGGAWLVARCVLWARGQASPLARIAPFAVGLPFTSIFWAMIAPSVVDAAPVAGRAQCRDPASVARLDDLPRATILAPIDLGADILALTRHSVLAAPYHRNNHGNGAMVRAMLAPPDAARAIVEASGARYVLYCPPMAELSIYAAASPDGLAAALLRGQPPSWLEPTQVAGTPYKVFIVR
jgi:hypothetical protein